MPPRSIEILDLMHWLDGGVRISHSDWNDIPHGFVGRQILPGSIPDQLRRCRQVHGIKIVDAATIPSKVSGETPAPEGDGIYTTVPGVPCGVQTADCLPLLFRSTGKPFVAAVHAGWRGLTMGILAETLALYRRMGDPRELMVAIGPAIGSPRFEVGPEVVTALSQTSMGLEPEQLSLVLTKGRNDRWHADLAAAAALQLTNLGIPPGQIYIMRSCTWDDQTRWFSYRREGKGCGMNISWIG